MMLLLGSMLVMPALHLPTTYETVAQGRGDDKKSDTAKENQADKDKKAKEEEQDKGNRGNAAITGTGDYAVEVACDYDDGAGTSTCSFTGIVPDGGKKINHLDVPEDAMCAEVIGGEYTYVEDDPHTAVTGYQTKGSNDTVTLVLDGHVVPAGPVTYWLKAANNILPVTGPGIECGEPRGFQIQTTPEAAAPTATPQSQTGELRVLIYTCADVPDDTTDYDWFRLCDSEGGVHGLELTRISEVAVEPVMTRTDDSGDASFTGLEPGLYALEMTDGAWCKAVSDNVDAEGNVIIEAGQRTTVYGFACEENAAA